MTLPLKECIIIALNLQTRGTLHNVWDYDTANISLRNKPALTVGKLPLCSFVDRPNDVREGQSLACSGGANFVTYIISCSLYKK